MNKRKDIFDKKIESIEIIVDGLFMPSVVYELEKKDVNTIIYNKTVVYSKSEFLLLSKDLIDSYDKEFFLYVTLRNVKTKRAKRDYLQQIFNAIKNLGVAVEEYTDFAKLKKASIGESVLIDI